MKVFRNISIIVLSMFLMCCCYLAVSGQSTTVQAQTLGVALQRGFRTGYSDGYMSGYRDIIDGAGKSYTRHSEYSSADRAFSNEYGSVNDYRDGYQQGFESGYETGYKRRSFESTLPSGLKKRGVVTPQPQQNDYNGNLVAINPSDRYASDDVSKSAGQIPVSYQSSNNPIVIIPIDTELMLELDQDLSTDLNREGDKFTAKVVSPSEIAGASIEGRIAKVLKPGKIRRRSEILLSFDRITLNDNRWSNFNASLIEVMAVKGDNISRVDNEGTALGQSSLKSDAIKVGAATGSGLVVGAVVGGPVGAAVGAGVGAAFGVGAVVINRGKHIRLNKNQQLRVKTAHETQIR